MRHHSGRDASSDVPRSPRCGLIKESPPSLDPARCTRRAPKKPRRGEPDRHAISLFAMLVKRSVSGVRKQKTNGTPGGIRTHDQRFRRPLLYPTELRGHSAQIIPRKSGVWRRAGTYALLRTAMPRRSPRATTSMLKSLARSRSSQIPRPSGGGSSSPAALSSRPRSLRVDEHPARRHPARGVRGLDRAARSWLGSRPV